MGKSHDTPIDSFSSFSAADKAADEPLVRVMALHALAYCERLFYLEEVEEIRRADAQVYDGRRLHENLEKDEEAAAPLSGLRPAGDRQPGSGKVATAGY
jgi:hypothetical protein